MKRLMKKTISIVCAVVLLFTGLAFVPQTVNADDVWYTMDNTWPEPHPLLQVPEGETSLWTGCTGPGTEIECANAFMLEGFKWNTVNPNGEAAFFKTIDLKDVACVDNGSGLEKPVAGTYYNMHVKLTYTPPSATNYPKMKVETSGGIKNLELTQWDYKHSKLHPEEDVLEHEIDGVVCMKPGEDFKFCINYGWLSDSDKYYMKKGIFEITEFTLTGDDSWQTVPNADPNFTDGPWNMFGNFIDDPEVTGNYGILQYKKTGDNPKYSDYTFRPVSVSGWEAWSVFARLENYLADYYDFGDQYDITLTLNSSKATVPKTDPEALDKLLIVVGNDKHYFELTQGVNTLRMTGEYAVDKADPHEQILLEMDGLEAGTELTVQNIQLTSPNDGWTNVPNKTWTSVGAWSLYSAWDETHWSKLAYKSSGTSTGLGAYNFRLRRTSKEWTKEASMATLSNYLSTAKDTKGYAMSDGDLYNTKVTINASGLRDDVTNYGSLMFTINGEHFKFDVQKGTHTYDLKEITGNEFTYNKNNTKDIDFEFDEMTDKAIVNISDIKIINVSGSGTDVPNGQSVKPEGTPWTLYAITDATAGQYGALKYTIEGIPADLSSLKLNLKSVSGWFGARSVYAMLLGRLNGLENGKEYRFTIKANIDESNVQTADRDVTYDKQLRVTLNQQDKDFDVAFNPSGVQTYTETFTYDSTKDNHVVFQLDQLLKGTIFSINSVEIVPVVGPTTTPVPSTEQTSSVNPSTEVPSTDVPTSGETVTGATDVTTKSGETTTVKAPGKAKIKKVYKKKKSAKKLKVKLKKTKGAKGYQVAVYKSKKTAKKNKKALVKKFTKKLKVTIKSKKLKKKKKLYVRARAYVLDFSGKKVYGKWSSIKKGKTKK